MTDSPRQRPGDQQPPVPNGRPSIHDLVIEDLEIFSYGVVEPAVALMDRRKALGLDRYKSLLQAFNGRDAHRDSLEEMADLLVYTKQMMEEHREAGTSPGPQLVRLEIIYNTLLFLIVDMSTLSLPAPKPSYGDGEQVQEPPAPGGIS
jgi:hypothetical protein